MSHVSLGVIGISTNYPKGGFVANHYLDGQPKKSKTVSIGSTDINIAYQTVDLWAEDKAKEMDIEYKKTSFKELSSRLAHTNSVKVSKVTGPPTKSNLGNIKFFKMEMKRAFKEFGADKIREVLKEGTKLLGELQREKLKSERNSGKAKTAISQAMYQTWIETSVDTSIYCTDEEIVAGFHRLQAEYEKINNQQGDLNV